MFGRRLEPGLSEDFVEKEKRTFLILMLINDHIVQPLVMTSSRKHEHNLEAIKFEDNSNIRLKRVTEIAQWT